MIPHRCKILLLSLVYFLVSSAAVNLPTSVIQVSDGDSPIISLSSYNVSSSEDQAFVQLININENATFSIQVQNIPSSVAFVIIQIHSFMYNVTLQDSPNRLPGNYVNGTNLGLLIETDGSKKAEVYITSDNNLQVNSLIAVVAYKKDAPYVGGCNMEFDVERSPFQKLIYDGAIVTVDAQPASVPKIGNVQPPCEKYPVYHEAYRMYMPEQDFSNDTYFSAIANMLTVQDIKRNAYVIPPSLIGSVMRRIYSVYPGTGSVYGMIATFGNRSSAYVPIVTYGCDPSSWSTSCTNLTTTFSKVICAFTFFLGLFVAMRGQYFFKISMFLLGTITGGYIGYTISSYSGSFDATGMILTAVFVGLMASLVWLLLWVTFTSPIPTLMLSGINLGSFFFFSFYFILPAGVLYLEFDAYFWLIYTTTVILVILIFSIVPLAGNILCFTVLGAYATILSLDYYMGSNLKYILINSIRRCTVAEFKKAVIEPPFQTKDILLTVFWAFLVILGLFKQCAANRNRAPFPPSTTNLAGETEETNLLGRRYQDRRYQYKNRNKFGYKYRPFHDRHNQYEEIYD